MVGQSVSAVEDERLVRGKGPTIDMTARSLGLDPIDVRRRNIIDPDDLPYDTCSLSDLEARRAMAGNISRSAGYVQILAAVNRLLLRFQRGRKEGITVRDRHRGDVATHNGVRGGTASRVVVLIRIGGSWL